MGHSKEFALKNGENATALVQSDGGVTLLGGGALGAGDLQEALALAPLLVAADGGAVPALAAGHVPQAVIGDMDSLTPDQIAAIPQNRLHRIPEQDSTDFDKALRHIQAPFVLAVGFTGARIDHELAVYHTLVKRSDWRCVIVGAEDIVLHVPDAIDLRLPIGTRVSLFPMGEVAGRSKGLRWPIHGLAFRPTQRIGTSNIAAEAEVGLQFDGPGMLLILPRAQLGAVLAAWGTG